MHRQAMSALQKRTGLLARQCGAAKRDTGAEDTKDQPTDAMGGRRQLESVQAADGWLFQVVSGELAFCRIANSEDHIEVVDMEIAGHEVFVVFGIEHGSVRVVTGKGTHGLV